MTELIDDHAIMVALQYYAPGTPSNTRLASLGGPVIIQNEYALQGGAFPALHIETERQHHKLLTNSGWDADMRFILSYFDRWEQQYITIDQIRALIDTDMQLVMRNLQAAPSLNLAGQPNATSLYRVDLSPYSGEIDNKTVPGLTLVKRTLKVYVNVLPYDV